MSQIQEIKQATDIVQLLSERMTLQRSGTNWRGLCPFHSEKSPSFFVSEQMQRYKCFGCNESGDVYTFLQKHDGMTFAESLQYLADRAGITLISTTFSPEDDQRKRVLEILDLSKEYYHYLLTEHKLGEPARQYLKERGVTAESIKLFQLGFSLDRWDGLISYLYDKKKYAMADLEAAGLIIQGQRGAPYDRFRGRIMFPLSDHRGRVVGFSGRTLIKDTKEAKYINTSETMVYHKSQLLFGFSQLYQEIRKAEEVIVVEGEFDVISSAQAHVNHVVAVKGSVLTEEHIKLLSRTVKKVILAFDMDKAGVAATKRAVEIAQPFELELRVLQLPQPADGVQPKDPDELARTNPALWRQTAKTSISVFDFFIAAACKAHDPETPEGKRHIVDEVAPQLLLISHAVEQDFYLHKLAETLHVKVAVLQRDLERAKGKKVAARYPAATSNRQSAAQPQPQKTKKAPESRKSRLESYALFLLFQSPADTVVKKAEALKHVAFSQAGIKQIVTQLLTVKKFQSEQFSQSLAEDLQQLLFDVTYQADYLELLPKLELEKEWAKTVRELIHLDIAEEITRITQELDGLEQQSARSEADDQRASALLHKIVKLRGKQQAV